MSFTYATLDQLFDTYERLQGEGITPVWCINHGPTSSMYYLDPMGNHVELQIDTMDAKAATDFIHSDVFEKNPIGIEFDPNVLNTNAKPGRRLMSWWRTAVRWPSAFGTGDAEVVRQDVHPSKMVWRSMKAIHAVEGHDALS
jgi:hypothetical protein